jgi:hypothetical protein
VSVPVDTSKNFTLILQRVFEFKEKKLSLPEITLPKKIHCPTIAYSEYP